MLLLQVLLWASIVLWSPKTLRGQQESCSRSLGKCGLMECTTVGHSLFATAELHYSRLLQWWTAIQAISDCTWILEPAQHQKAPVLYLRVMSPVLKVNCSLNTRSASSPRISAHISDVAALLSEGDHWPGVLKIIITFLLSSDLMVLHPDTVMEIQLAGWIYFFHDKNMNLSASCKASVKLQNKIYAQPIEWWLRSHRFCGVYWTIDFGSWNGKPKKSVE